MPRRSLAVRPQLITFPGLSGAVCPRYLEGSLMKIRTVALAGLFFTLAACNKKAPPVEAVASALPAPSAAPAAAPLVKLTAKGLEHLPPGCEVVVHIDTSKALAAPVVKQHLVPELERMSKPDPQNQNSETFRSFLDELGMDPLKDLASVSVCMGPEPPPGQTPPLVSIVGGTFGQDRLLSAFRKHSPKKGIFQDVTVGGLQAILAEKLYTTQAKDGAALFGTDQALLAAAVAPGEAYKAYEIPSDSELSVRITKAAIERMSKQAQAAGPFGQLMGGATSALITVTLAERRLRFTATHADATKAKAGAKFLDLAIKQLGQQAMMAARMNPQAAMMADVARLAKVSAEGQLVVVVVDIPAEALEGFFQQVSMGMSQQMAMLGAPGTMPQGMPPGAMPPGAMAPGMPPGAMAPGMPPGAMAPGMPQGGPRCFTSAR
jgi:hypothetical protein